MTTDIVTKIGRSGKESGISRRNFLKIAGAASAVTVAGCADSPRQNIFPNVHGTEDQIPGVAVWFRSTCTECSAGCGIEVRTREGRAVKIEGSSENPINRGGLCAIGQGALQDLYDPDRIRQPLIRAKDNNGGTIFKPIAWSEAYEKVATVLNDKKAKKVFITGEVSGALSELIKDWSSANEIKHVVYESVSASTSAKASELVYGTYGIPAYSFDKAQVVLNLGADFLETWVSPCEYARDWAKSRKSDRPVRVFHVEPRLSLTGGNADSWLACAPGSELQVALGVLKIVSEKAKGEDEATRGSKSLTAEVDLDEVAKVSGVPRAKLLVIADHLTRAEGSLVIAGGTAASTDTGLMLQVVAALLNVVLGNVGKTVNISRMRKPQTSANAIADVIGDLNKGDVKLLMIDRSNPVFTLPQGLGFEYAAKMAKMVVSFSSKLDETARLADIILPASHSIESWGDSRPLPGVNSLIQPAMSAVFDTKSLGDMIVDFFNGMNQGDTIGKSKNFKEYLQSSWKKLQVALGVGGDFEKFWNESVERGGYFKVSNESSSPKVDSKVFSMKVKDPSFDSKGVDGESLIVYPFASIKTFDGRAANRPWMQELPDPMTQVVWDAWAEMHPETAKKFGVAQEDVVTLRNDHGEINLPVYVTEYVHKGIVAVPMGQGHESFGRYAEQVGGANVMKVVSPSFDKDADAVSLLSAKVSVSRSRLKTSLVHFDGSRSQMGRGIARTKMIDTPADLNGHGEAFGHEKGAGLEAAKESEENEKVNQMYDQRVHPLYHWGMAVDLASCTGCSACVVACYAENNIQVVGKELFRQGREMAWLRIDRYFDGEPEELTVHFMPMMCQHCGNAPCEPVCPVYATYHNEEGTNSMVYNRCVGTRYCANNCSYKVRRFNWFEYDTPEPLNWQFNPDVVVRSVGVMEKCSFCSQRIMEGKDRAKDHGRPVQDGEIRPACVQSCPTEALSFGNLNDPESKVSKLAKHARGYKVLDHHINTQPSITYLEDIKYSKA